MAGRLLYTKGAFIYKVQHVDASNGYAIFVPDNATIEGVGRGATKLLCGVADTSILYARAGSHITVRSLTLDGNATSNNADCLKFLSCAKVNLYDVEALAARIGIQLLGCTDVTLSGVYAGSQIEDSGNNDARAFSIGDLAPYTGTSRISAANCWAYLSEDHGWAIFTNASDVQLTNCGALSCTGSGLRASNALIQVVNFLARANNIGMDVIESAGSRIHGHAIGNSQYGLRVLGTQRALFDVTCRDNSVQTANTYSGVYVGDSGAVYSILNEFRLISGNTVATGQKYGYESAGSSGNNKIGGNLQNNQTGPGAFASTDIKRNIIGYVTEAGGTGAIASGATSVAITHGLSVTPAAKDVTITPTNAPSNAPGHIYVDTCTSTQFTVHCSADPGVSTLTFGWHVTVL